MEAPNISTLISVLEDQEKPRDLRLQAASDLFFLGSDAVAAVPVLRAILRNPTERWLRGTVAAVLSRMGVAAVPAFVEALDDREMRWQAAIDLIAMGPDAVPALRECLTKGPLWIGYLPALMALVQIHCANQAVVEE
jgi:hypothetical protein